MRSARSTKQPDFPVWAALEYLGAQNVPRVHGAGRYAKMPCPFHEDRHPSASVSEFGFFCFPCMISGDAIKLIREQEGVNYKTALAILEKLVDPADSGGAQQREWGESLLG